MLKKHQHQSVAVSNKATSPFHVKTTSAEAAGKRDVHEEPVCTDSESIAAAPPVSPAPPAPPARGSVSLNMDAPFPATNGARGV